VDLGITEGVGPLHISKPIGLPIFNARWGHEFIINACFYRFKVSNNMIYGFEFGLWLTRRVAIHDLGKYRVGHIFGFGGKVSVSNVFSV
jgi:hypothetical protein